MNDNEIKRGVKDEMLKKTIIFSIIIFSLLIITTTIQGLSVFEDTVWPWVGAKKTAENVAESGIMQGVGNQKFDPNGLITNRQVLVVFSRLITGDITLTGEGDEQEGIIKNIALNYGVQLPSDLVYIKEDWVQVWKDIIVGKTLFEKVGEDKYSVTLIPGYFKIYLNEKGHLLFKKGLIPPQIGFYSPFTTIEDLTDDTLDKPATKGFVLELMSIYDGFKKLPQYELVEQEQRAEVIRQLTTILMEQSNSKEEKDWGSKEINRFNYVSMSYGGVMQYGILRGYISPDNTIEGMNKPVKRIEVAAIIERINGDNTSDLDETLKGFIQTKNIDVFEKYLKNKAAYAD